MQRAILTIVFIIGSSVLFSQTMVRIGDTRVSEQQLDARIGKLMKEASVTGIAVSVLITIERFTSVVQL